MTMELRYLSHLLLVLICAPPLGADESTWITAPTRGQLELDPTLIPKGKGMLFVPTMTSSPREPNFLVFQGGREIAEATTGSGVLLSPGIYKVMIGSGSMDQMVRRKVEVVEGYTTLMKPVWSGLVIDVIDQNRTSTNDSYELFGLSNQENYGIGFGVEEERGESVRTWLLPPGVYEVVRVGDNISTTRKFSVRLEPGELVQRNLVVETQTGHFIGFYPQSSQLRTSQLGSHWKSSWELSGSTLFNTSQNTTGEDRASISFSGQVLQRSRYNSERHLFILRLILEEGLTKEERRAFRKSIDELEVRGTYIYRLLVGIGPYLRGVLNTKLLASEVLYDNPRTLHTINAEGDTTEILTGVTEFTLSPSLNPLHLRQGIGINSQLIRSFPVNVDLRIGLGARQTYVSDTFALSTDRSIVRILENSSSTGFEALLVMDARLSRFASLDSEFDILMPSFNTGSWDLNWENRFRLVLSRYVNMDIVVDLKRDKEIKRLQSREQVLLRFVYLL